MLHKRNIEDIRQIGAYRIGNESLSRIPLLENHIQPCRFLSYMHIG
jgi:hypothetical protein